MVVDLCATDTLTIDVSKFTPTLLTYNLRDTANVFTFTDVHAVSTGGLTNCGDKVWTITKSDTNPVDSSVFTLDIATATATKKITTQSSDATKAATYPMTVTVKYTNYLSITDTANFNILVVDLCAADTLTIDPSVFTSTLLTYNLRDTANVFTFTDVAAISTGSLTNCGDKEWTITKQSDGSAIDASVFTLDIATATASKTITTQSSDAAKASTYGMTVTVKYIDYSGVVTPATKDFDIMVVDLCATDTLTLDTSVFIPSSSSFLLTYNLRDAANVFTFTDAAAISTGSLTNCGDKEWTITKGDGTPLDASVITLDIATATATKTITT